MKKQKSAFTMLELVMVIVVIGILASIAVPKMIATRDDAIVVKGRAQVAAIRNGISLQKSKNLINGDSTPYPDKLDSVTTYNVNDQKLFFFNEGNSSNILEYPKYSKKNSAGYWLKTGENSYKFFITNDVSLEFDYNSSTGSFNCNYADDNCKKLTQ